MLFRQVFKGRKAKQFNYSPLYYDKKKAERETRSMGIKFKRHQYFADLKDEDGKKTLLSGKVQGNRYSGKSKMTRYGLFLGLMAVIVGFVKFDLRWEYAILLFLILLVALIREVNKL